MILRKQPNRWSCSLAAWCMAAGIPLDLARLDIGHDGSEVLNPYMPEPQGRRGFHTQELVELVLKYGDCPVLWELFPSIESGNQIKVLYGSSIEMDGRWKAFQHLISTTHGVIEGHTGVCQHAVAYNFGTIYDPNGVVYEYSRKMSESHTFYGKQLWIF